MKITTVLFDLDGTLLPMDQEAFVKAYIGALVKAITPFGCDSKALANAIMAGTVAMVKNTGEQTNEDIFWQFLVNACGPSVKQDMSIYDEFYRNDFQKVRTVCGFAPEARLVIDHVKELGLRPVLATNPLFPTLATESRIRWAGLDPKEFALYTTYETSHYCKPNPAYYREVLDQLHADPSECLMVGNDVGEDMIAEQLGMRVFLLTDCIINRKNEDISRFPHGGFADLLSYLNRLA